tara:strand:+ start:919 stop:1035 length:117 start_codon:yes stop_codon:yes gene_type:complete
MKAEFARFERETEAYRKVVRALRQERERRITDFFTRMF